MSGSKVVAARAASQASERVQEELKELQRGKPKRRSIFRRKWKPTPTPEPLRKASTIAPLSVTTTRRRRYGLGGVQRRLILGFTAVLLASLSITGLTFARDAHERFRDQLRMDTWSIASTLAASMPQYARDRDREALEASAMALIEAGRASEIAFFDTKGGLIAYAGVPEAEGKLAELFGDDLEKAKSERVKISDLYAQASAPVIDRISWQLRQSGKASEGVGDVVVRVSTRELQVYNAFVEQWMVAVGTGVGLLAVGVAWMLVRNIVKPLKRLIVAVRRITSGESDVRADERDDAQLGGLPGAFNDLIETLVVQQQQVAVANAELERTNRTLEQTIVARTGQLEVAAQRLKSEIAEKEDFLRAVSHDLNAPLRNIGGMVSMLLMKNKDLPADVLQRLDRIKKNVEIETDLINEMLELSRIKTRRQTFEKVDLESMMWDLRGLFENDLKTRHIDLMIDSVLPPLWAEKGRIRQVFQNLIDNAIKYMGERPTREIHVGARVDASEVEFWVRDTGTGIAPEDIDKVFFVFRRGRSETTQKTAGKGVGLASVKSIIETYSGRIWVESRVNEGTTFRFTINGKFVPALNPMGVELNQQSSDGEESSDERSESTGADRGSGFAAAA